MKRDTPVPVHFTYCKNGFPEGDWESKPFSSLWGSVRPDVGPGCRLHLSRKGGGRGRSGTEEGEEREPEGGRGRKEEEEGGVKREEGKEKEGEEKESGTGGKKKEGVRRRGRGVEGE